MTEKIPKKTVKRVKDEREEDYSKGFNAGVEFAKKSNYSTIEAVARAIRYKDNNELFNLLPDDPYHSASTEYRDGFYKALKEVLEKSEEEDN